MAPSANQTTEEAAAALALALGRYGQSNPKEETPEFVRDKLQELEKELSDISDAKKSGYLEALEKSPDLCDDAFKLQHLRCELFDLKPAAKRIVAYWDMRLEIFGSERAFLPLTLSHALKDDTSSLHLGFIRNTLHKDDAGRAILFIDPSRIPHDQAYDRHSMARALWYNIHAAIEEEDVQRKGIVIIAHPEHAARSQMDRKLMKINVTSIKGCLPVRIAAFHVCNPPLFFEVVFSIAKVLMGERLRKRIKIHSNGNGKKDKSAKGGGSVEETTVIRKLVNKYGIDKIKIPSEVGGGNTIDHVQWLEDRKVAGL